MNYQEEKEEEPDLSFDISKAPFNECPGCHGGVNQGDRYCSSCGLRIITVEER